MPQLGGLQDLLRLRSARGSHLVGTQGTSAPCFPRHAIGMFPESCIFILRVYSFLSVPHMCRWRTIPSSTTSFCIPSFRPGFLSKDFGISGDILDHIYTFPSCRCELRWRSWWERKGWIPFRCSWPIRTCSCCGTASSSRLCSIVRTSELSQESMPRTGNWWQRWGRDTSRLIHKLNDRNELSL